MSLLTVAACLLIWLLASLPLAVIVGRALARSDAEAVEREARLAPSAQTQSESQSLGAVS